MRDEGRLLSGNEFKPPPAGLFLGAVENPFAPPEEFRAVRAAKKIAAGAQFLQAQYVFDVPVFERWVKALFGRVTGVTVPESVQRRLRGVPADQFGEEGHRLAAEVIAQVKEVPGVAGVHLLTAGYEKGVPGLLDHAGVARGRGPGARGGTAADAAPLSA
ncbi:MAG: methylenetetrahydrofolate reductase [Actinomycetia bacterium]|nr:methylenetetrahydrofolate reductase [Actinomycetes bacterium]